MRDLLVSRLAAIARSFAVRFARSRAAPPPWPSAPVDGAAPASGEPVPIYVAPTAETFDEEEYLYMNPDVAAAVAAGAFPSGRAHFDLTGDGKTHRIRAPDALARVREARRVKLERIRPVLRDDVPHRIGPDGVVDCLDASTRARFGLDETENVSSHGYGRDVTDLIARFRDGLILDCGAGSRDVYFPNVVNLEIARHPSTDVLAPAERLPFRDASFDAVVSIAVLEHVKYPFEAAKEICRVLKPGGAIFVVAPFLQPLHGYPSHYFNMTHFGLRTLFEPEIAVERQSVGPMMGPMWAMHMIARDWFAALPEEARPAFLDLRIADILKHPTHFETMPYVSGIAESARFGIASATSLSGRRVG